MATAYRTIYRQTALRINAIAGTDSAAIETAYADGTWTSGEIDSVMFPYTAIKDAILDTEGEIAGIIAGQTDHPYRAFLQGVTASLSDGEVLPIADASSNVIVGVLGSVRDATDSVNLTAQPLSVIKNIRRNSGSFLVSDYYYYCIVGNRIRHTRSGVIADCCIYDRSDQATVLDTSLANGTGDIVLPDALAGTVVAGAVSRLVRDDEFANQAQVYRNYYESVLRALLNGGVHVPSAPAAMTTTEASA